MTLFGDTTRFVIKGTEYDLAEVQPELVPGEVRRFTYGAEPKIIAQVPVKGGGSVEIHGYVTHYNQDWADVVWTDETMQHLTCWVPAADVRRPGDGEWQGLYVQF